MGMKIGKSFLVVCIYLLGAALFVHWDKVVYRFRHRPADWAIQRPKPQVLAPVDDLESQYSKGYKDSDFVTARMRLEMTGSSKKDTTINEGVTAQHGWYYTREGKDKIRVYPAGLTAAAETLMYMGIMDEKEVIAEAKAKLEAQRNNREHTAKESKSATFARANKDEVALNELGNAGSSATPPDVTAK